MEVESKTSDEILEELFSALNVPISPKAKGVHSTEEDQEKDQENDQERENSVDSDGTEDKDADAKSSDTDVEEPREQEEKATKNHKHKSSKKKKEKKKKKKKHKKKDEDGRHKSKKKHKKSSSGHSGEEDNNAKSLEGTVKTEGIVGKLTTAVTELAEESVTSNNHEVEVLRICSPKPKSPKSNKELNKSVSHNSIVKNDSLSDAGVKELKKLPEKPKSPRRSHSSSKSFHSRSRSSSRTRHQQSRSMSRHDRHSRSRSRSRSKTEIRHSRSNTTSYKSKARSPYDSDRLNRKRRYSRSRSRSLSPKLFKKWRYSRSHSKSPLSRSGRRRSSRSYSRSLSPKFSRRKRHLHSRSPSPVKKTSRYRSRSRSRSRSSRRTSQLRNSLRRSPENTPTKDTVLSINGTSNASSKVLESSSAKDDTLKDSNNIIIDLSSIPTPDVHPPVCTSALPISLENIPLPVPPVSSDLPDPSSIPLPLPIALIKEEPSWNEEPTENKSNQIDLGAIPVPTSSADVPAKEQEPAKPTDTGAEKSKAKMIIIKSLKDSLIYMQAQEEAERRAKVKQDEDPEVINDEKDDESDKTEDHTSKEQTKEKADGQPINEEAKEKIKLDEENKEEVKVVTITSTVETEKSSSSPAAETVTVKASESSSSSSETAATKGKEKGKKSKNGEQSEMEDGEILSENEDATPTEKAPSSPQKTKSHKKKSKKDKDKSKEKKKSKKEKSKDKKRSKERSKSKDRTVRSRSRSKERSKHRKSSSSWHRDHDSYRRHRRYSRSRSRSRERHSSRFRHRSYSRSRSRSRSRSGRKRDCVSDLRDKVTRKRLLDIARRNAVYLMQNGCLPPSVEQEQLVKIKTGGKSVEELTDFCKQLVATGNYSDAELSDPSLSSDDDNDNPDKPFSCTRHPFSVRDSKPILMNIRNAPMLPTKTNAERLADHAKLREQFPVSSGSQHRTKGEVNTTEDKLVPTADSGWVPVSPKEKKPKEEDSVFSKDKAPSVDISQIVSSRLSAMRKLQDNPHDMEALKTLHNVQKDMQTWALSKQEPGQFTGSTGVKILSQEELCAGQQAWVRKEQFKEAAPVRPQFGLKMLQKMGWTPGEGLGKNKEGAIEPLLLDVKMDKKGFHAQEELTPKKQPIPMAKDLSGELKDPLLKGKHPVSALVELCSKHKWQPPEFEMVFDYGPDHKKNFLMKVKVNGQEYKPAVAGPTKKLAKANAAAACLQSLGLFPRDPENPLTEATQG